MTRYELSQIHKLSYKNREMIERTHKCGCFYCKTIFNPDEIVVWLNDGDRDTAECPYCYIDAVIPETDELPITNDLLVELNKYAF